MWMWYACVGEHAWMAHGDMLRSEIEPALGMAGCAPGATWVGLRKRIARAWREHTLGIVLAMRVGRHK